MSRHIKQNRLPPLEFFLLTEKETLKFIFINRYCVADLNCKGSSVQHRSEIVVRNVCSVILRYAILKRHIILYV